LARQRLGQHFLTDALVVGRILALLAPAPGERFLEIGPGKGALTWPLLRAAGALDCVELDRELARALADAAARAGARLQVHQRDVLSLELAGLHAGPPGLRLVGNLPYNITSPLLFHLHRQRHLVADMTFMVQEEVARRLCAAPGSRRYGRLGVMLAVDLEMEYAFSVPPGAFSPPPRVSSAVVRLRPRANPPWIADRALFARLVATAFNQRRKTLRNALRTLADEAAMAAVGIAASDRPEAIAVESYVALANHLATRPAGCEKPECT